MRHTLAAVCLALIPLAGAAAQDGNARYPDALFGDWGGVKSGLADAGIKLKLDYVTETDWTVAGGAGAGAGVHPPNGIAGSLGWGTQTGIAGKRRRMSSRPHTSPVSPPQQLSLEPSPSSSVRSVAALSQYPYW